MYQVHNLRLHISNPQLSVQFVSLLPQVDKDPRTKHWAESSPVTKEVQDARALVQSKIVFGEFLNDFLNVGAPALKQHEFPDKTTQIIKLQEVPNAFTTELISLETVDWQKGLGFL